MKVAGIEVARTEVSGAAVTGADGSGGVVAGGAVSTRDAVPVEQPTGASSSGIRPMVAHRRRRRVVGLVSESGSWLMSVVACSFIVVATLG